MDSLQQVGEKRGQEFMEDRRREVRRWDSQEGTWSRNPGIKSTDLQEVREERGESRYLL